MSYPRVSFSQKRISSDIVAHVFQKNGNRPFAGQGYVTMSIIKIGGSTKWLLVARNGKSMMKLVGLPILRPLLLKHEILWQFENQPSHTNP